MNQLTTILAAKPLKIIECNMACLFDYDVPSDCPEWFWVKSNSSFKRNDNFEGGVWDFILNLAVDFSDIPLTLLPLFDSAKAADIDYILFHQGC
ncbi:hypothetical protein H5185_12170 [Shewanella sp. SG44-6]|jgi:hypothetical protein|uniref:hypothetical protein n=1 Tax=Shewanella sp. SG44-6 TaxID=2760959 RepID=UPI0015FFA0EB|nr:hypothetical protein [Shewanella sp. SG44-6]MBB1390169.1 hypothetical protein [Shewanella sp. SG44-6]